MKEYEELKRIGTLPHRAYYIPFGIDDKIETHYGIVKREKSSRFISLDGIWKIKEHKNVEEVILNEELKDEIEVPSCVQIKGYDHLQYINVRYPYPVIFPHVPYENPCWHYQREIEIKKSEEEKYYINFEGVDSAFYLYINGTYKGYSQISHATSEFDITNLLKNGKNTIDVVVLKWCASSYLEDQDKLRFSGIFRSVYILKRPKEHITDYFISTNILGKSGEIVFKNESPVSIDIEFLGKTFCAPPKKTTVIPIKNLKKWSAENPFLYTLIILSNGEKIVEKVGVREIKIEDGVVKLNGEPFKFKGVNRHDFNYKNGATVTVNNLVKDIKLMKELNVNGVRTSHYPNMPEFYQLCDYFGICIMDECDLETHGMVEICGGYEWSKWSEFAENMALEDALYDRDRALVERDKNRSSVLIWSLGNESSFGKPFLKGAKYIKTRDKTRLLHYEGIIEAPRKYYFNKYIDVLSIMYPSLEGIKKLLSKKGETRPLILCEYTHAMGNSSGDIADYWKEIYNNPRLAGGFVWEWADHAVKRGNKLLYGGDFGEREHDGNFCCDGLLTGDRKIKSAAREMQAVYGGKTESFAKDIKIPLSNGKARNVLIVANEHTGELTSIKADGKEILFSPLKFNIRRYVDNDREYIDLFRRIYNFENLKQVILTCEKGENSYLFKGVLCANGRKPAVHFDLSYKVQKNVLEIAIDYKIADYIEHLPRMGFEFAVEKNFSEFSYIGFGPYESYVDKHVACDYGLYDGNAYVNYDRNYIRPQESGSHYFSRYLNVKNLFEMTASKEFSFSVNPYTTEQIMSTTHNFDLPENPFINICVDLFMAGMGSHSCGPEIQKKYEVPKEGSNKFRLIF